MCVIHVCQDEDRSIISYIHTHFEPVSVPIQYETSSIFLSIYLLKIQGRESEIIGTMHNSQLTPRGYHTNTIQKCSVIKLRGD